MNLKQIISKPFLQVSKTNSKFTFVFNCSYSLRSIYRYYDKYQNKIFHIQQGNSFYNSYSYCFEDEPFLFGLKI